MMHDLRVPLVVRQNLLVRVLRVPQVPNLNAWSSIIIVSHDELRGHVGRPRDVRHLLAVRRVRDVDSRRLALQVPHRRSTIRSS